MKNLKRFLAYLFVAGFVFTVLTCGEDDPKPWELAKPLKETYPENEYFMMGNIISPGDIGTERFDILKYHFNTVTAENHMKPENIAPNASGGDYKWTNADNIVNAAQTAGLKVHGHTLIWHSQTPDWLGKSGEDGMKKYIDDVMKHFKGKVISWDVVNEAIKEANELGSAYTGDDWEGKDWKSCLRTSPWKTSVGEDYIEKAFLAAREADPDAQLYYNDFALNWNPNNSNANKAKAVYNMVKDINERYPNEGGRPLIDGIGMQSHHHLGTSPETIEESIKQFSSLGVDITISEMDIVASDGGGISGQGTWGEENSQKQAKQYAAMFKYFKQYKDKISRVTFWGIDDGTSWRSANHATLLDSDYNLKEAFYAVQDPDSW